MGFFSRLLGIGLTAGATVAAMKVADKYKENQKAQAEADVNGDGKTDFNDTVAGVAKAAGDVYADAAVKAKDYANVAKQKATELYNQAPELINKAKDAAKDALDGLKSKDESCYVQPGASDPKEPSDDENAQ